MNPPRYGSVSRKSNLLSHIHAFSWWGLWKQVKLKGMGNLETTGRSVGFGQSEARVPCCGSTTVTCSQGSLVLPRELQSRQALNRCPLERTVCPQASPSIPPLSLRKDPLCLLPYRPSSGKEGAVLGGGCSGPQVSLCDSAACDPLSPGQSKSWFPDPLPELHRPQPRL